MPFDLESLTAGLFAQCDEYLGDTIGLTVPGSAAIAIRAHVSHAEERVDYGASAAVTQDIGIDLDRALVPGKPAADWRITLPRIPAKVFAPRDVRLDESGYRWVFGLKDAGNG